MNADDKPVVSMPDGDAAQVAARKAKLNALLTALDSYAADAGNVDADGGDGCGGDATPDDPVDDAPDDHPDNFPDHPPKPLRFRDGPNRLLPQLVLDRALGPALKRRLRRNPPLAIVVQAPGADWVDPLRTAAKSLIGFCDIVDRDGSKKQDHKPTIGNPDVATTLRSGRHSIGISQAPDRHLPSTLTTLADARVVVRPPDGKTLRRLIAACVGRPPRDIPDDAASGLSFSDIMGAFRTGASPARVVANLVAASTAKCRASTTDDTPPLDRLPGCDPAARAWGLKLADDYAAWRRGDLTWKNIDASMVMTGLPGTGKTTFAKALAATMRLPLIATNVGDWFANSEGNLDDVIKAAGSVFAQALSAQGILFIDEIDGIPNRATLSNRGRDWWLPLCNYLLLLFDSAQTRRDGCVIISATNMDISFLDPALVRPGRLGRHIEFQLPDASALADVLRYHLGPDVLPKHDLADVTRLRPGATPALAAQWARDAVSTARDAGRQVTIDDLVAAVAPDDKRSAADQRVAAIHEAGHVVVALSLGRRIASVSIVSQGGKGGVSQFQADLGVFPTRADIDGGATLLLGGRAAEIVLIGAASTGAEGDLAHATQILAHMHVSAGLGADLVHRAPPDDAMSVLAFDPDLRRTIAADLDRLHGRAVAIVDKNRAAVVALADALVARRFLDGADAEAIVKAAMAKAPRRPTKGRTTP